MKKPVRSWDLFDTLIGRRCGTAKRLFDQLGDQIGDPGFTERRITAERWLQDQKREYGLPDIYEIYAQHAGTTFYLIRELMDLEWQLELSNVFPIRRHVRMMRPGDIIVSDMYLSEQQLRELIIKAGIEFSGEIFVSCYGKRSGGVWYDVKRDHQISSHWGDNMETDVKRPVPFGIQTRWVNTGLSEPEVLYTGLSQDLSWWMRRHRLEQVEDENSQRLEMLQIQHNIPMLWAASILLMEYAAANNRQKLLFMSRDGQIWLEIFRRLYPDQAAEYLYISRECLRSGSGQYFKYLNSKLTSRSMLVDLAASCGSLVEALPRIRTKSPWIWAMFYLASPFEVDVSGIRLGYGVSNRDVRSNNAHLEKLNYGDHWHVADVQNGDPVYDQAGEYDMDLVRGYHELVGAMMEDLPDPSRTIVSGDKLDRELMAMMKYALTKIHEAGGYLSEIFPAHSIYEKRRKGPDWRWQAGQTSVVIGAIYRYGWDQIRHWIQSLKLTGYKGEIHLICCEIDPNVIRAIREVGVVVHEMALERDLFIVDRFRALAEIAQQFSRDQWILFADVGDIVFQQDPSEYLGQLGDEVGIVVASEGVRFKNNKWTRENLRSSFPDHWGRLKDEFFYNAGSMAARSWTMIELCKGIVDLCDQAPNARAHDQAALNILLRERRYKDLTKFTGATDGWCYCAASSMMADEKDVAGYEDDWPVIRDGRCYVGGGVDLNHAGMSEPGRLSVMFHHYTRDKIIQQQVHDLIDVQWKK